MRRATAAALVQRFHESQTEASIAVLTAAFAVLPEPEQRRLLRLYRAARETVYIHLQRVIKRHQGEVVIPTWLSDRAMYDHTPRRCSRPTACARWAAT